MKALMSPLAKQVLADPQAREQVRAFLAHKSRLGDPTGAAPRVVVEVPCEGTKTKYKLVVVPKAA